jgi:hypothetical protein
MTQNPCYSLLIIKYLPPYSPELNLIEILWRFMKYYWLPFSAYMFFGIDHGVGHLCAFWSTPRHAVAD